MTQTVINGKNAGKMKKTDKVFSQTATTGIVIDPMAIYSASECCKIVGVNRATLSRYIEERRFPLKPVGNGRAVGKDILEWLDSQPIAKVNRGPKAAAVSK